VIPWGSPRDHGLNEHAHSDRDPRGDFLVPANQITAVQGQPHLQCNFIERTIDDKIYVKKIVFFTHPWRAYLNCWPGVAALVRPVVNTLPAVGLWLKFQILLSLPFRFRLTSMSVFAKINCADL